MVFACLAKHDYSEINIMFTFEKEMKGIFFSSATGASGIVCKMILKKVTFEITAAVFTNSSVHGRQFAWSLYEVRRNFTDSENSIFKIVMKL